MHKELIGLSNALLKRIAPRATHQHYKGGLYLYLGKEWDIRTQMYMVGYEHIFPHTPPMELRGAGQDGTMFYIPQRGAVYTRPLSEWEEKFKPLDT